MTGNEILNAHFLDLLFENRNKEYGAYALRKFYQQRLATALGLSFLLVSAVLLPVALRKTTVSNQFTTVFPDDELIVHTQTIIEPPPPEPLHKTKPQRPAAPVAQQQFTQIRITNEPVKTTDVPPQTDLTDVAISSETLPGNPASDVPVISDTRTEANREPDVKAVTAPAYIEPQFPGGAAAWATFLSRNLRAPEPLEEGEKKTVVVRFVVGEDGTVGSFEVVRSDGAAFDAEVIRVLKKMPKWKPARKGGHPVAVPFTQPVAFVAMGD